MPEQARTLAEHAVDILKGALSAALVAGLFAFLQYLGTHIPELLQFLSQTVVAVGTIKKFRV